jgi:hypothetical protein
MTTGPVQIPPGDLALLERLIRIETKLDDSRSSDADHETRIRALEQERHPDHERRLNDHETRLRRVERSVWIAAGACAAAGGVVGSIVGPLLGQ